MLHAKLRNRTCQGHNRQGKDKDQAYKDQDNDLTHKDQDKDLNLVLKETLRTRTRINITDFFFVQWQSVDCCLFLAGTGSAESTG